MTLVRTRWDARRERSKDNVIRLAARITATHLGCEGETATPIYYRFENENERLLMNVVPFASCAEIALVDGIDVVPLNDRAISVG